MHLIHVLCQYLPTQTHIFALKGLSLYIGSNILYLFVHFIYFHASTNYCNMYHGGCQSSQVNGLSAVRHVELCFQGALLLSSPLSPAFEAHGGRDGVETQGPWEVGARRGPGAGAGDPSSK